MELIEFVRGLGYPIVAAGKGKNNAFRIDATPDEYVEEAKRRNMNPRMLVEFVDGSKTMVEMVAIANATGLVPDVPGMHGPGRAATAAKVLVPREDGGMLSSKGVVDFTVGKGVAPGVFVVAEMRHPRIRERMNDLHLGEGPYYTFFRPYHLTSLEVPLTAAPASCCTDKATWCRCPCRSAEVCAVAKRDLAVGETLDAIGENCYRGFALSRADALAHDAMPLGLAQGAVVRRPIAKGALLSYANCAPDERLKIVRYVARRTKWCVRRATIRPWSWRHDQRPGSRDGCQPVAAAI